MSSIGTSEWIFDKITIVFQNKVLEALAEKESEQDVQVENDELKKENKDLKNQIKKLKKVKTGQGDEALEVWIKISWNANTVEAA